MTGFVDRRIFVYTGYRIKVIFCIAEYCVIVCKVNTAAIVYGNESLEAYIFVAANAVYDVSKRIIVEIAEI